MKVGDKICVLPEKVQATVHAMTPFYAIVTWQVRISVKVYRDLFKAIII